jgi:hypothetical protein
MGQSHRQVEGDCSLEPPLELLDRGGGSRPLVDAGFKVHRVNFLSNDGNVVGHVDLPHFALLAEPTPETSDLLAAFPAILEGQVRPPPDPRAPWLIRPDGYVAMAAAAGDGKAISDFYAGSSRALVSVVLTITVKMS